MDTREQDIVDFRHAVEEAYGDRLTILREELNRVQIISENCEVWYGRYFSWQPKQDNATDTLSNFDRKIARNRYAFGKRVPAIRTSAAGGKDSVKDLFPTRKQALQKLITLSERYIMGATGYIVPHAIVQYTIYKYMTRDWSGPRELAEAYDSRLLSPGDQAQYLLNLYSADRFLASKLLSILSRITESLSVYQAVCSGNSTELITLLSSEKSNAVSCAQEITAWEKSLPLSEIADLDKLKDTLQSIHENFFLHPSFPVLDNDESDIWYTLSYYVWPTYPWGDAEQAEQIRQEIIMLDRDSETVRPHLSDPPLDIRIDSEPQVEAVETNHNLPAGSQVRRPPRFVGDAGEEAFKRLFEKMNNNFYVTTYENIAGLFRCPSPSPQQPSQPVTYNKIEWIDDDGERGVQYFVEALYRVERNKPAADLPSKKAISKLFFTKSKKNLDIGKNSLYCWGKNKSIDHSHSQEKKIEGFLDIIDKALKPSGMSS